MDKKQPKFISVTERPIIIVGEKMGRQRESEDTYALEGNRTGDFVHEAIEGLSNIILTNVVNYLYPGPFDKSKHLDECLKDLQLLIDSYKPCKIITLGYIAKDYVKQLRKPADCIIWSMPHPSYINRFHSSKRAEHIKILRHELEQ